MRVGLVSDIHADRVTLEAASDRRIHVPLRTLLAVGIPFSSPDLRPRRPRPDVL